MSIVDKLINSEDFPDKHESLADGIDMLLPYIWRFSEGLEDFEFYVNKRWIEVRGDVNFHESILHVFKDSGEYLRIMEGDIATGSWAFDINGFILKYKGGHELYELSFLNESFFILRKHGDHVAKGRGPKYLFFTTEVINYKYQWPEILSLMFNTIYKQNSNYLFILVIFIIAIGLIVFLSLG